MSQQDTSVNEVNASPPPPVMASPDVTTATKAVVAAAVKSSPQGRAPASNGNNNERQHAATAASPPQQELHQYQRSTHSTPRYQRVMSQEGSSPGGTPTDDIITSRHRVRETSYASTGGGASPAPRLGYCGTSSFRNVSSQFKDPVPTTAHIDGLSIETTSLVGKLGPKVSFTKATDRFKTVECPTKNVDFCDPPTSFAKCGAAPAGSGVSPNRRSISPNGSANGASPVVGVLTGGGERFVETPVATVNVPFCDADALLGVAKKKSFHNGPTVSTAPRFSAAKRVPKSSTSAYEQARVNIDYYVPPGMAAKCVGGRGVLTSAKRFANREPITRNIDYAQDVSKSTLVSARQQVPGSSSLRSAAPRFEKTRTSLSNAELFVPRSFVEEILMK